VIAPILPVDVSRCHGRGHDGIAQVIDDECRDCRRRTDPDHGYWQSWLVPIPTQTPCNLRIKPMNDLVEKAYFLERALFCFNHIEDGEDISWLWMFLWAGMPQ
jgi:hypothetical protein